MCETAGEVAGWRLVSCGWSWGVVVVTYWQGSQRSVCRQPSGRRLQTCRWMNGHGQEQEEEQEEEQKQNGDKILRYNIW